MGWLDTLLARNHLATNEVVVGRENLLQNVESSVHTAATIDVTPK